MKPSIKRYHPYEARSGKSQNAGVGLFIKDTLDNKERSNLTFSSSGKNCDFECLFIELECKMLVGVVYRHPNNNIQSFTNEIERCVLEKVKKENKKVVIMGDFNINLMNCESHRHTSNFFDTMVSSNFLPSIVQPTRFNKSNHTLIDNIFYNDISSECIGGNLIPHITDHLPNFLMVPHSKNIAHSPNRTKRYYSDFDIIEFKKDLLNIDFENNLSMMGDTNLMYNFFHKRLNLLFDLHAPYKELSKKQQKIRKVHG